MSSTNPYSDNRGYIPPSIPGNANTGYGAPPSQAPNSSRPYTNPPYSSVQLPPAPPITASTQSYGPPPSTAQRAPMNAYPPPPMSMPQSGGYSAGPPNSVALPNLSIQRPISQNELLDSLSPASSAGTNLHSMQHPTHMPTSYRTGAPPPISTNTSYYGSGLDSRGSVASNRSSGNYGSAMSNYNTGIHASAAAAGAGGRSFGYSPEKTQHQAISGGHSPSSRSDANRIDPSQMPRPDKPLFDVVFHTKSGSGRRNPPSCNSIYTSIDTGNCIPRHIRSTLVINVLLFIIIILCFMETILVAVSSLCVFVYLVAICCNGRLHRPPRKQY